MTLSLCLRNNVKFKIGSLMDCFRMGHVKFRNVTWDLKRKDLRRQLLQRG